MSCDTCYDTKTIDRGGAEVRCPDCKPKTRKIDKPTFSKQLGPRYRVRLGGTLAGTVEKISKGYWIGYYSDGCMGYAADTRIDCAWKLINS